MSNTALVVFALLSIGLTPIQVFCTGTTKRTDSSCFHLRKFGSCAGGRLASGLTLCKYIYIHTIWPYYIVENHMQWMSIYIYICNPKNWRKQTPADYATGSCGHIANSGDLTRNHASTMNCFSCTWSLNTFLTDLSAHVAWCIAWGPCQLWNLKELSNWTYKELPLLHSVFPKMSRNGKEREPYSCFPASSEATWKRNKRYTFHRVIHDYK